MTVGRDPLSIAERVRRVEPSATLAISSKASQLEAEGIDVVDCSVGEPDFDTPENIVAAGKQAIDDGYTHYTPAPGIPELREEIAAKLRRDGAAYDPSQVIVTPGAKQAIYETVQTLVESGDEVVLLDPAWVSYPAQVELAGGDLTRVDLAPHDFRLEPALDALADAVSDRTALLVVNSPSNPTGAVYSRAALEGVRDLAVEHDVTVVSDEIYGSITYDVTQTSVASLDGMGDRTVTINGFSKAYAMTGWRLGYLAGPPEFVDQARKLHSHSVSCATNFVQHAGVEALRHTDEAVESMVADFRERRDLTLELFADEGVDVPVPDGAFYLMVPVDEDDHAWCTEAIERAHVAMVPGSAFGAPGYARLSYATGEDRLREAVARLADADLL